MDNRVDLVSSRAPQDPTWSEEPDNQCRAPVEARGGAPGSRPDGAEGAGGSSWAPSVPAASKPTVSEDCQGELLAAAGDCVTALLAGSKTRLPALINCVASTETAVECVIKQYQAKRAK